MDINPIALSIGPINIYWYGLVYALGFIFTLWFILKHTKELQTTKDHLENTLIYTMIAAVLGGRIFHIIFYNLEYFLANPAAIIRFDQGGMSIHGGLFFGFIALYYFTKKYKINFLKLTDLIVIPLSLVMAFGRVANYINQELVGKITDSNLGVEFQRTHPGENRYPSQLFEALKSAFIFNILAYLKLIKNFKPGIISAYFLILYNGLRFIINFTREPEVYIGILGMGQVLSLIFMILGFMMLYKLRSSK